MAHAKIRDVNLLCASSPTQESRPVINGANTPVRAYLNTEPMYCERWAQQYNTISRSNRRNDLYGAGQFIFSIVRVRLCKVVIQYPSGRNVFSGYGRFRAPARAFGRRYASSRTFNTIAS